MRGDGTGTVAVVDLKGRPVFGVNSTALVRDADKNLARQWAKKLGWDTGKAQTLFHGEGHALLRANEISGGQLPSELNMYVDRYSCAICRANLPDLTEALGVKKLNLFFKDGSTSVIENGKFVPGE